LSDTYSQTVSDGKFINNTLTTTTGDIIYASGANTPARLAIGTSADVLTVSGGIPAWAAPAAGGMTLLETISLSTTSHTTSSISQDYVNIMILIKDLSCSANANVFFRINGNATGYYGYYGVNATLSAVSNVTYMETGQNMSTNGTGQYMIDIPNYTDTSGTNKLIRWVGANNSTGAILHGAGNFASGTANVTTFTISTVAGTSNINGTLLVYGVK
jgi:hypothetical protein